MKALTRLCLERPVAALMTWAGIVSLALVAAFSIPVRYLPEIPVPRVVVTARYPGYSAEETRALVAIPLEDALAQAKGSVGTRSVSRDGRAVVVVDFAWGESAFVAATRVREAIDAVYRALPDGAEKPVVAPYDPSDAPLLVAAVRARSGDLTAARSFAELQLKTRLQRADGVGAAVIVGGAEPEIVVEVDARKAAARGADPGLVARAISEENAEYSVGTVKEGTTTLGVRVGSRAARAEEFEAYRVHGGRGSFAVGETALVREGHKRRESVFALDGREWTGVEVYGRAGASPVSAAAAVREAVRELEAVYGGDYELAVPYDGSRSVVKAVTDLALSAAVGAAAAFAVVALFARNLGASLLIVSTIPVSATLALGALAALGSSLNTMSLGGLALGIGMMSDNAVVVLERLRDRSGADPDSPAAMAERVGEVAASAFASTLTSVIVFLPIVFLPGELGAVFGDLAKAFVCSLVGSWLLSMTLVPALFRLTFDPARPTARAPRRGRLYPRLLKSAFRKPLPIFGAAAALALVGGFAFSRLPVEFMPGDDAGEAVVEAVFPPGTDIEFVGGRAVALSGVLRGVPGVRAAFGRAGGDRRDLRYQSDPDARAEVLSVRCALDPAVFPDSGAAALRLAAAARAAGFGADDGAGLRAYSPPPVVETVLGSGSDTRVAVFGDDPDEASDGARRFAAKLGRDTRVESIALSPSGRKPSVRVSPDREAAAAAGIGFSDAARQAAAALEGSVATTLERGGRDIDVRVRAAGDIDVDGLGSLVAALGESGPALLSDVARTERVERPEALARLDRRDVVYVDAKPARDARDGFAPAVKAACAGLDATPLSEGAFARYASRLLLVVGLVVLLLYLFLGAQFESFGLPALLLLAIPLSFAGVSAVLLVTGSSVNFGSILGVIVLFGIAVNNTIILWEVSAERHAASASARVDAESRARSARSAAFTGALSRLEPILTTALTNVIALAPALFSPSGAAQRAMSAAILGGMLVSTSLSLLVAPVAFARKLAGKVPKAGRKQDAAAFGDGDAIGDVEDGEGLSA